MDGLTRGRVVHYVLQFGDPGFDPADGADNHRAAIVNATEEQGAFVRLTVFADPIMDSTRQQQIVVWPANTIPFSDEHLPRTWHWPERA